MLPDAITFAPFVLTRCPADWGLMQHELVHYAEQQDMGVWTWWWRYLTRPQFRMQAEVRAYRRQIAVGGISPELAAKDLTGYYLGITEAQALALFV